MPSIADSLARLYRLHAAGIKFGLETERALLARLGHPEAGVANFIHVAGTNGKGSVCAMLEAVLRAAGLKTGLYTSPHLIRFNERIRVNGACIADEELAPLIDRLNGLAAEVRTAPGGREVTFFEFTTALAFEHFRRQSVDIVILETGMGGRLDATNVVTPVVSVITGIGLDHTEWLGHDEIVIAGEKCGIIKPGRPVVVGPLSDGALAVARAAAQAAGAPLIEAARTVSIARTRIGLDGRRLRIGSAAADYGTMTFPLLGAHQLANAAVAIAALEAYADAGGFTLDPTAVKRGLSSVQWPGRLQVLSADPVFIVDGAHNPAGAGALARTLHEVAPHTPIGLVAGLCADKDIGGFFRSLTGPVRQCWTVAFHNERSVPAPALARQADSLGCPVTPTDLPTALAGAEAWARANGGAVCVAGSLFLAGEVLALKVGPDVFAAPAPAARKGRSRASGRRTGKIGGTHGAEGHISGMVQLR